MYAYEAQLPLRMMRFFRVLAAAGKELSDDDWEKLLRGEGISIENELAALHSTIFTLNKVPVCVFGSGVCVRACASVCVCGFPPPSPCSPSPFPPTPIADVTGQVKDRYASTLEEDVELLEGTALGRVEEVIFFFFVLLPLGRQCGCASPPLHPVYTGCLPLIASSRTEPCF